MERLQEIKGGMDRISSVGAHVDTAFMFPHTPHFCRSCSVDSPTACYEFRIGQTGTQKEGSNDCGVAVCKIAELLATGKSSEVLTEGTKNLGSYRKQMLTLCENQQAGLMRDWIRDTWTPAENWIWDTFFFDVREEKHRSIEILAGSELKRAIADARRAKKKPLRAGSHAHLLTDADLSDWEPLERSVSINNLTGGECDRVLISKQRGVRECWY